MANETPKPASVSTGDAKSKDNTPPKPSATQPAAPSPEPSPEPATPLSREQRIEALLKSEFVSVEKLVGAYYTHIGKCLKCGFQTMQNDAAATEQIVLNHTFRHVRDVLNKL